MVSIIAKGKSAIVEVALDVPTKIMRSTFKKHVNHRDPDKSAILNEQENVPIRIVKPHDDSLIINMKGVITSGLNMHKRKHPDDSSRKKNKKQKSHKNPEQRIENDVEPFQRRHGMEKTHIPNDEDEVEIPQNFDYEEELVIDRGRMRTAGGATIATLLTELRLHPLSWSWIQIGRVSIFEGRENPFGFAFCETGGSLAPSVASDPYYNGFH